MQKFRKMTASSWATGGVTAGASAVLAWIVLAAPLEASLGAGIRSVYLHVGLIWAGMAGIFVAGALGLIVLAWPNLTLARWARAVGLVGLLFFVVGMVVSLWAQRINWGGIFWAEPRMASMLRYTALGTIVHILLSWPLAVRLKGGLLFLLATLYVWSVDNSPLVLHPKDPIGTSPSTGIQTTFVAVFVVSLFLAAWLAAFLQQRLQEREEKV